MTKSLIALLLVILPGLLIAQSQKQYDPIDSVGWELPDFSELQGFDRSDLGSVTYLLVLTKSGQVKKIKTLSNTLNEQTELKLRNQIGRLTLSKKPSLKGQTRYKGTLEVAMESCMDSKK